MPTLQPPTRPEPPEPIPVPWIAALTPVVLAFAMTIVFQQILALLMGLLGPAMVLGSWVESRRVAAKSFRRVCEEFENAQADYAREVEDIRARDKAHALALLPPLRDAASQPLWRTSALIERGCRIGCGWAEFPEGHVLFGTPALAGMPSVVDPRESVCLVGGDAHAGLWRTLAVSWVLAGTTSLRLTAQGDIPRRVFGLSEAIWVESLEDVPEQCDVVILGSNRPTVEVTSAGITSLTVIPDELSSAEALWILRRFSALDESTHDSLDHDPHGRGQLWCSLSPDSPTWDLVREGPHAVVWGATGSGKSVTVSSLVQNLAQRYSPESLVCVLIDFKGGAGLRPLWDLPHTVGSMTDLEGEGVSRALVGLHSELARRERILDEHGVTDIADLEQSLLLPRLVVVIDEVAWLLANFPEFHGALSDVLARGRSLGVHVILSTQRVTGVLSQGMMANISLRLCGRVVDSSDALSWIPDISGALRETIRHLRPGEIVVAGASLSPALHTVTMTPGASDNASPSSWRVWAQPLPRHLDLTPDAWALADDLSAQTHRPLRREDRPAGSCLVVGDPGMGKSVTLATLASAAREAIRVPRHPLLFWLWWQKNEPHTLRLLDDLDLTLAMAGTEGAQCLLELLHNHSGPVLMSARPDSLHHRAMARMAPDIMVLGINKSEVRQALGGIATDIPGRAQFRGETIQIAQGAPDLSDADTDYRVPEVGSCVVTRRPDSWAGAPLSLVISPEELARRWSDIADRGDIVLDRISPLDIRGATLGRIHPPPLPVPDNLVVVWREGGFSVAPRAWWQE